MTKEMQILKREMNFYLLVVKYIKRDCYMKAKAWAIVLSNAFMLGLITEDESIHLMERGC